MQRKVTALIALTTTACTSWHVQPGPAPSAIVAKSDSHGAVRLILKSGSFADIYNPEIVGDSIIGMAGPVAATRDRVAFATADVESVATKQVSAGRTILALAAIGLAVAILVGSASSSTTTTSSSNSSCALLSLPSSAALA